MARSRDYEGIEVVFLDHAVEVDVPILFSFAFVLHRAVAYVNDCPASLPQWPSNLGLKCSFFNGS